MQQREGRGKTNSNMRTEAYFQQDPVYLNMQQAQLLLKNAKGKEKKNP